MTKPSRSLSKGRLARVGSSLRVESDPVRALGRTLPASPAAGFPTARQVQATEIHQQGPGDRQPGTAKSDGGSVPQCSGILRQTGGTELRSGSLPRVARSVLALELSSPSGLSRPAKSSSEALRMRAMMR